MRVFTYRQAIGVLVGLTCLGSFTACGSKSTPVAKTDTTTKSTVTTVATTKPKSTSTTESTSTTSADQDATSTTTAGDSGGGAIDHDNGDIETVQDTTWSSDAGDYRGKIGTGVRFDCPKNGTLDTVWGTDIYTDDSSVCNAAVHAGLITLAAGGSVVIKIVGPEDKYIGSTRNGIVSQDYGSWGGSYMFPDAKKD